VLGGRVLPVIVLFLVDINKFIFRCVEIRCAIILLTLNRLIGSRVWYRLP